MAISKTIARISRHTFNPLIRPVAERVPPLAVVRHRGRVSGRAYRTPVLAFRSGDRVVIVLFYGADTDWVRNVLAQGGCELRTRGRTMALAAPDVEPAETRRADVPAPVRLAMRLLGTGSVLHARVDGKTQGIDAGGDRLHA